MGLLLLLVLILLIAGGLPTWDHTRNWGYGPSSLFSLCLVTVVVLVLVDVIHFSRF